MSDVITGLFNKPSEAAMAINELEGKGVSADDISLIANETVNQENFGIAEQSKMPEGAAIGAVTGGVLTAVVAGLTAVGAVATGGAGLLISGPTVAALAGAGAGATAGTLIGGAIGAAIPEHEVKYYEDAIKKGSILLGVKYTSKNKDTIKSILKHYDVKEVATA